MMGSDKCLIRVSSVLSIGALCVVFVGGSHYWQRPYSIKHFSLYPQFFVNRSALCLAFGGTCSLLGTCLPYRPVYCNGTSICCGAPFLQQAFFTGRHGGGYGGYGGGYGGHNVGYGGGYGGHNIGYGGHGGYHGGYGAAQGGAHGIAGLFGGYNPNGHVKNYEQIHNGGYGGWTDYGGAHDLAAGFNSHKPLGQQLVTVWKKKRKRK